MPKNISNYTPGLIVKKSKINKKGFFAARDVKKGEVVLRWHPKILSKSEVDLLPDAQKHFVDKMEPNKYALQNPKERFMNHSCEPNTKVRKMSDVAIRDIKKGEEVTSDYGSSLMSFRCKCGSKRCRGLLS